MKAELIRNMPWEPDGKVVRILPPGVSEQDTPKFSPKGTVIDDKRVFMLVQMGIAVPVDDECVKATNMSEDQMTAAQKAYPKLDAGIIQEDFAAFDAGLMTGYNHDGSWIPGPNAPDDTEDLELADEDEDYEEDEDDE